MAKQWALISASKQKCVNKFDVESNVRENEWRKKSSSKWFLKFKRLTTALTDYS